MAFFEDQTFEAIMERMLSRLPDDISKEEGDVVYDLLAPAAIELVNAYLSMDMLFDLGFADTTYGEYLDRRAAEQGLTRKESVKASGVVTLNGNADVDVPAGTRLATAGEEPVYFLTTEDVILTGGSATIGAEAEVGGEDGNVGAGEIVVVTGDLQGVIEVTNSAAFSGGFAEESDEELLERYKQKVSQPATSGNKFDYEQWAKEVVGVSEARCYPTWNGPGTVKVVVINAEKRSPSQLVINEVFSHIESLRPVNADVTISGVTERAINVSATLTLTSTGNIDDVRAMVNENLTEYFKSIAFTDSVVRYSQVANAILDANGVLDYANLTVNGQVANIELANDEVPIVGAIVLN